MGGGTITILIRVVLNQLNDLYGFCYNNDVDI